MLNLKFKTLLTLILMTLVSIIGVLTTYYMDRYHSIQNHSKSLLLDQAFNQLTFSYREYHNTRDQFASVVQLLSRSQNLYSYISQPSKQNKNVLEKIWASVLANQKWFNAIRFVDQTGHEKLRVDYSIATQNVKYSNQYVDHFTKSQLNAVEVIKGNDIFIQSIHLNLSGNSSESYDPEFSLVAPVTVNQERVGYIVMDVAMVNLLTRLNYSPNSQLQPSLVSNEGYFYDSPNLGWRFGNLIESRKQYNLAQMYPETWQLMQSQASAYHEERNHILAFSQVSFSPRQQYFLLIILSNADIERYSAPAVSGLKTEAVIAYFVVILLVLPMAFFAFYVHKKGIDSKLARAALDGSSAMIISDQSHRVLMVNEAFEKMTSLSKRLIRGKNPLKLLLSHYGIEFILEISERLVEKLLWEGEVELTNSLGLPITVLMRIQAVKEHGEISYYIISLVDISDRKELENQLRDLSERDSLTGLWNRGKFEAELMTQCHLAQRYPETHTACLAIIDIDHFKRVNDMQGHDQGDRVIISIGNVLTSFSRNTDFIARIGGEEYGLILPHTGIEDAEHFLQRLCKHIQEQSEIGVTISAGVTDLSPDPRRSYKCADIALYEAKTQGRNQVSVCLSGDDLA